MAIATIFLVCSAICFGIRFAGINTGQIDTMAGGWLFIVLAALAGVGLPLFAALGVI